MFAVKKQCSETRARRGTLILQHGTIETPAFMPVATKATVKTLTAEHLQKLGAQFLICNTYHLMLKPGAEVVEQSGGLHSFMNWDKPLLTDSGGFQAFSLGAGQADGAGKMIFPGKKFTKKLQPSSVKITDEGVYFRSIYDQSKHLLTPESSIKIQEQLGADLILVLDECTSPLASRVYTERSLMRTHAWAERCVTAHKTKQALAGIVQGGHWKDLREKSAQFIASLDVDSVAIGGSLGRSKNEMHQILEWVVPYLPAHKARHLLGIGVVGDIFEAVERGVDLFDCVSPTRIARDGYVHVFPPVGKKENKFRYKITSTVYALDAKPLDEHCNCTVCQQYSRAYINHLFKANEMLGYTLVTYHNLHFLLTLMREIREAIGNDLFLKVKKKWMGV